MISPRRSAAVGRVVAFQQAWKRYYGWTYLERVPSGPPGARFRATALVIDRFGWRSFFQSRLNQAGLTITPEKFVFTHFLYVLLFGLAGRLLGGIAISIIIVLLGAALPPAILPILAGRRRALLEEQLADTLQLISSLLKAGHGFPQALAAVARETQPPISIALHRVISEVDLGGSLEEGLDKMAAEVDSVTLTWAVTAIKIQREVGGNLSEILDTLGKSIRERGEIARQVKALTAEGRMSAYILLSLPFVLMAVLYFSNREYMSLLWTTQTGWVLLAAAGLLMLIGIVWLRKLVKIEV